MHTNKFELLNSIRLGSVRLNVKKSKKVAIISRAIFIIEVRYLENKCGLSVWDGYLLICTNNQILTLTHCKVMLHPMRDIFLLGHFVLKQLPWPYFSSNLAKIIFVHTSIISESMTKKSLKNSYFFQSYWRHSRAR